jgi:hypothetical protein
LDFGADKISCRVKKRGGKEGGEKACMHGFLHYSSKKFVVLVCTVHFFCTVHACPFFFVVWYVAKTTMCVVFPLLFSSLHVPRSSRRRRKTLLAFPERGARGSVARRDEPVFPPLFRGRSGPLATEEHSILDQRACEALGFFFCTSLGSREWCN